MKHTFLGLLLATLAIASLVTNAQGPQLTTVVPPTPNAAAFQKYGDIPVSAYTGIPDISIPLYTVKFRDITIPVSLSYHASGIKVAEEASQVGLGWVLNAGGNISRNIVGYDDFDGSTYFNNVSNNIMDFSDGQIPASSNSTGCVLAMINRSNPNSPTQYNYDVTSYMSAVPAFDFEPDQYYYSFQGHSGKFILKRNKQAVIQNQEKMQLTPASDGSSWHVQTADGFAYDFMQYEYYHDNEFTTGGTAANHISAWYLTTITSPTGNTVTFTYTTNSNFVQNVGSYSETRDDWDYTPTVPGAPATNTGWQKGFNPGKQYTNLVLSAINFTNGKVVFNYSTGRIDLAGDLKLDSVSVYEKDGVTLDKTVAMTYAYFDGEVDPSFNNTGTVTDVQSKRLKLTQVTEKGYLNGQFIQNPPYSFTYNDNSSTLPAKTSFARDHWGYYNGLTGQATLIPAPIPLNATNAVLAALGMPGTQRDPNPLWAQAFMLTQINYPSGGYTHFDYESNDYDEKLSEVNDFSWFANQEPVIATPTAFGYDIVEHKDLSISDTLDLTNESMVSGSYPSVTVNASFRFSGGTGANCNDIGLPANVEYFELRTFPGNALISHVDPGALSVCNAGGTNSPCVGCTTNSPVFSYSGNYSLAPGKYIWSYHVDYTYSGIAKLEDMHATYTWYSSVPPNNGNITTGGGLRILRMTHHDAINEANNNVRKYIYHYWTDKTNSGVQSEFTYGRRMSKPQYSYFKDSYDDNSTQTGSGCVSTTYYTAHLMRSSDSDIPLNGSAKGAVVGYDAVTELFGETGQFGKKVYSYINNPDVVGGLGEIYTGLGLPERPSYGSNTPDMTNGSLLSETDYANVDGNFVRVKSVANSYSTVQATQNAVYGLENRPLTAYNHGDRCSVIGVTNCSGNEMVTYQSLQSNWNFLSQTEEKTYDQQNQNLLEDVTTSYYYENPSHMQLTKTVTTNSKGELMISHTQYPLDFTNTTGTDALSKGIAYLQNNFVVSKPVEKYIQRSNSDGSNLRTTNAILTTFNANKPTPSVVSETEITSPITSFTPAATSGTGSTYNSAYQSLLSFDSYDAYGNLLQQHKIGNLNTCYIWDYNISMPVCEVRNAGLSDVAYTSFEADGTGNWTVSGGSSPAGGITGNSSHAMTGSTISKTGLSSANSYIVSYWTSNSTSYSISGTVAGYPIKGKTINGWTYFEHKLTGQTGVSITGTGNIDELRLYPAAALMSTITYAPLVGVTSQCDAGNKINYYFYDALGRLRYIKDQDGNIVKTIQYHLVGQTGN